MAETKSLGAIIGDLKTALSCDSQAIAAHLGLRRQFVYAIRDNAPELPRDENRGRVATAGEDPRYVRINALCKLHGIEGLLDAVDAKHRVQRQHSLSPTPSDYREAYRAWCQFENECSHGGADNTVFNDPEVARLSMELGKRLQELAK